MTRTEFLVAIADMAQAAGLGHLRISFGVNDVMTDAVVKIPGAARGRAVYSGPAPYVIETAEGTVQGCAFLAQKRAAAATDAESAKLCSDDARTINAGPKTCASLD